MDRIFYVVCDDDCRIEGMSKEQIFAAIAEATGNVPSGLDDAFITKIKESNTGGGVSFWVGTEAEFNAISPAAETSCIIARVDASGKVYLCTDDSLVKEIERVLQIVPTKQNQLAWLNEADLEAMWEGTYTGTEDEHPADTLLQE